MQAGHPQGLRLHLLAEPALNRQHGWRFLLVGMRCDSAGTPLEVRPLSHALSEGLQCKSRSTDAARLARPAGRHALESALAPLSRRAISGAVSATLIRRQHTADPKLQQRRIWLVLLIS